MPTYSIAASTPMPTMAAYATDHHTEDHQDQEEPGQLHGGSARAGRVRSE